MYGTGLFKGLRSTMKHWVSKEFTEQYPEQRPDLAPASHSFFNFEKYKCIACGLCERACPNQVIKVEAEKNEAGKRVIAGYTMELSYCLFCGLCIEACPTKALTNANNFELSVYARENTKYDFFDTLPADMNATFEEVQAAYWNKVRPEGNPIGKPTPVPPPKPTPPAAKPAAAPAADAPTEKKEAE